MKNTKIKIIIAFITLIVLGCLSLLTMKNHYENKIKTLNNENIKVLKRKDKNIKETRQKLNKLKDENNQIKNEYDNLKNTILYSKELESQFDSTNYQEKDLRKYEIMTIDEMNKWIEKRAPKNSPFVNKGETFLKASVESNLDPKYLVAHAALESAWGTSPIARQKGNYFGIGAYNASPSRSAYRFNGNIDRSIIEGAVWISKNYTNSNQETLNKMQYGKKTYCTYDDGKTPDPNWITKIVSIVY